jgi:hypothetical protein
MEGIKGLGSLFRSRGVLLSLLLTYSMLAYILQLIETFNSHFFLTDVLEAHPLLYLIYFILLFSDVVCITLVYSWSKSGVYALFCVGACKFVLLGLLFHLMNWVGYYIFEVLRTGLYILVFSRKWSSFR